MGYAELASAVSNAGGLGIVRTLSHHCLPKESKLTPEFSSQLSPNPLQKTSAKRYGDVAL